MEKTITSMEGGGHLLSIWPVLLHRARGPEARRGGAVSAQRAPGHLAHSDEAQCGTLACALARRKNIRTTADREEGLRLAKCCADIRILVIL